MSDRLVFWLLALIWMPLCVFGIAVGAYSAITVSPVYSLTVLICSWGLGLGTVTLVAGRGRR